METIKSFEEFNKRSLSDKECLCYIRNIMSKHLHSWIERFALLSGELEGDKAAEQVREMQYNVDNDGVGFGYKKKDFKYKEGCVEEAKRNLETFRQILLYTNEKIEEGTSCA